MAVATIGLKLENSTNKIGDDYMEWLMYMLLGSILFTSGTYLIYWLIQKKIKNY